MSSKLNQILAVEKGVKKNVYDAVTGLYKRLQKKELLSGIARKYQPKDEEGDILPPESTKLQVSAELALTQVQRELVKLFDVTFAKDATNTRALVDLVVDGETLITNAPVTYLLFLEKQLLDLTSIVNALPVLDPSENWHFDANAGAYATDPIQTTRTKKIPRNHVKAPATDKHPAQVEVYYEDVLVGYWNTVKFSGAVPQTRVNVLRERVEKLQQAVKFAREQANNTEVVEVEVGARVMNWLFA